MRNISTEDPKDHWSFLQVKDKLVLDMGCSFYEAYYHPGMLSSAEWFVQEGARQVVGFDGDPAEVEKYSVVYKDNPKYQVFELWLNSDTHIRELLELKPEVIKCDIEGAEINFMSITKEEMDSVEEIAFEYHDVATREMCEKKLPEWGFTYIEQFSLLDRSPEEQGVYYGSKNPQETKKVIKLDSNNIRAKKVRGPKVLYIGPGEPELKSFHPNEWEDDSLNVKYLTSDKGIAEIITSFQPDSIITVGESDLDFTELTLQPYDVRKRWYHFTELDESAGNTAHNVAMYQILEQDNSQLISIFTPSYNTGVKLYDTYISLKEQTYTEWEWVIVDDSNDGGKTLSIAENIAKVDPRVKVFSFKEKSKGNIGDVKYKAASLTRGYLLVELDHDDMLTDNCLIDLRNATLAHPEAGFFYSDFVEVNNFFQSLTYDEGFALAYGSYEEEEYRGRIYQVNRTPNINPKTIRHIVGVPNHTRAWRRDTYFIVGGHNRDLTIADDYELIIRTFLNTQFVKIPKLGYIQFMHDSNSQDNARGDIQRKVKSIMFHYNERIAERFKELGVTDYVYEENPNDPLNVPSCFGNEENAVNLIYIP